MSDLVRVMPETYRDLSRSEMLRKREWLVTNGLGGYAAGTVSGIPTRRYHGMLVAALASPFGRMMMFNHLSELVRFPDGSVVRFGGFERENDELELHGMEYLRSFRLEEGLPVWEYDIRGTILEKRVFLLYRQNSVFIRYRLLAGDGVRLKLQPAVHFRSHDAPVDEIKKQPYVLTAVENRYQISLGTKLPPLRFVIHGRRAAFTLQEKKFPGIFYRIEYNRGYECVGDLWSPGYFAVDLLPGRDATLVASTEKWETMHALDPGEALQAELERRRQLLALAHPGARHGIPAELVYAADQFIITPAGRIEDSARAHAAGDEIRTVIAGYHWFTDWGRDTMISLEGLTLTTGRHLEAGWILRTFAHYVRDGLIPNMFPEGENDGLYHTADATMWFFHAVDRYLHYTKDRATLRLILPKLLQIVEKHFEGTRFGIGVDPADGLIRQGAEGYQLTWMDAKVGDWVVTPRRGKAVEINALWYNALRLMEEWTGEELGEKVSRRMGESACRVFESFNRRFWFPDGGYLYDVIDGEDGNDEACRPNQIFSFSLRHPVLEREKWRPVLETVRERLLTPVGLRSLGSGHRDYKTQYFGDLRSRDAAYHQGTVWSWLIGPFIDAWLRVHPHDAAGARKFLEAMTHTLDEKCMGTINEVYDADPPFAPRGCVAQAWSVAEMLRAWLRTERNDEFPPLP